MSKVYSIEPINRPSGDTFVYGVFSTRVKAQENIELLCKKETWHRLSEFEIITYDIDRLVE